jgi:riboflavin synthase
MFTGIIEQLGLVETIYQEGTNKRFRIKSELSKELKVDQSVSHNGVCLTVITATPEYHEVVAVEETLKKSTLAQWRMTEKINLERCMLNNGRFDGHIVQGHVDQVGTITKVQALEGSWLYDFEYDPLHGNVTVEKGSISINGISLTCFNSRHNGFTVTIIPYTYEHTNFHNLKEGDKVNLEFDIVGKYIKKLLSRD